MPSILKIHDSVRRSSLRGAPWCRGGPAPGHVPGRPGPWSEAWPTGGVFPSLRGWRRGGCGRSMCRGGLLPARGPGRQPCRLRIIVRICQLPGVVEAGVQRVGMVCPYGSSARPCCKKRRRQVPTMSGRRLHGVREPRGRSGAGPRCRRQGRTTPCRCRPWRCRGSTTLQDTPLTRWFAKRHSVLLNVLFGQGPERFCATPACWELRGMGLATTVAESAVGQRFRGSGGRGRD